ncbi:dihydrofolate reductase [Planococcus citri]|uniref:dihydrofolate reductase n=1 Tax=Planococcus citri TaxID=170843 RepID=UPI0031F92D4C
MKPVHAIAAMCENNGIGRNGGLPWKLKKEMDYFTRMTSSTKDSSNRNAVIMGRKTWESIPNKYKPLANRLNVVVSKQMSDDKEMICFKSVTDAVKTLQSSHSNYSNIETIWVIGGYNVYKEALDNQLCDKLFLTRIKKEFECDVFFPEFSEHDYQLVQQEDVSQEVQIENSIEYYFQVHEKKTKLMVP